LTQVKSRLRWIDATFVIVLSHCNNAVVAHLQAELAEFVANALAQLPGR
jgi:hypothetical protein